MAINLKFLPLAVSGIVLFSIPACSSGNDFEEDGFEIIERDDSISDNNGKTSSSSNPTIFKLEPYFPLTKVGALQGAALCGDYLFHANSSNSILIYNIREKKHITTLKLETMGHADTMSFGRQKVDESDDFPVLYVSGSQSNTIGKGGDIYVYRIQRLSDETGEEKWQGTLIQHIVTPDVAIIGSFPDIVIDQEKNIMWIMGWLTSYPYDHNDGSGCTNCFSKYGIPDIYEGVPNNKGVYQLTLAEEKRMSYFLIKNIHAITQGLCYYKGKIICPYGNSFKGIDVIDVLKEKLTYNVNLKSFRIGEPEAVVIHENQLYLLDQGNYVYSCSGLEL